MLMLSVAERERFTGHREGITIERSVRAALNRMAGLSYLAVKQKVHKCGSRTPSDIKGIERRNHSAGSSDVITELVPERR